MRSNLPKILITVIFIFLLQSSKLFSQEIWDLKWTNTVTEVSGGSTETVDISPDGSKVVSGSNNSYLIKMWNAETGNLIWTINTGIGNIRKTIFSPDGNTVLIGSNSGIAIRSTDGGGLVWSSSAGYLYDVNFSSDGSNVVSAGFDEKIKVWNAQNGNLIWTGVHDSLAKKVVFSSDGNKVASCSDDGVLKIWDAQTGTELWHGHHSSFIWDISFSPDGSMVASAGNEDGVKVWDANDGSLLWTGIISGQVKSIDFDSEGNRIAAISSNGIGANFFVWNSKTGSVIWENDTNSSENDVNFSPDGNKIVTAEGGGENFKVKIWDASNGEALFTGDHSGIVDMAIFSSDNKTVVSASWDNTVKLWHYEELVQLTSSIPNNDIKAGTTFNISWSNKNVEKVNLEYSINNGSTWTTIADNLSASLGNYVWTIPNVKSSQCKIRISNAENADTKDETSTAFNIYIPSVTLTNPADGDSLRGGTTQTISWTSERVSTVSIYYSTNNGTNWNTIINNIPAADKNYDWQIPLINSSTCKIAIVDSSDTTVRSENNGTFTIYKPFELTNPSAGSLWEINTLQNITWTSSLTDKIGLEYSTDSSTTWTTIISSISANVGYYIWTIPETPSKNCRIRIFNPDNLNEYDESEGLFTIYNRELKLISPNGGEQFIAGHKFNIVWENEYVNKIMLEYSSDSGINWNLLANDIDASSDSTTINIPDISSQICKIKITDIEKTDLFDESDSVFSIYRSSIIITSPKGGENWVVGTTNEITWTSSYASDIKIEYTIDNGANWKQIVGSISAETGKYIWTIPNTASSLCKVRLTDKDNLNVTCESDSLFNISLPSIIVTNPKGGESWIGGTTHEISWSSPNTSNIKIEYTSDNGASWNEIVASVSAGVGKYFWIIPNITSSLCKIRLTDKDYPSVVCESDSVFTIYQPVISITSPSGGETWTGDTQEEIIWFSAFVSNVKIELSLDNGGSWRTITSNTPADSGKYLWTVPDTTSTLCKIRITGIDYPQALDENDSPFSIDHAVGIETEEDSSIPTEFTLFQNYPNPFNPTTTISYSIPEACFVTLKVYDVLGNEIATLVNGDKSRGIYKIDFNASNITSGIYFYRITTNGFTQTKKMTILK